MKEPKDLGIKIGTEEQSIWERVKKQCEASIKSAKNEILIQDELLLIAIKKIDEEQKKLKPKQSPKYV